MAKNTPTQLSLFGQQWQPKKKIKSEKIFQNPSVILAQKVTQFLSERRTSKKFASHDRSSQIDWRQLFA